MEIEMNRRSHRRPASGARHVPRLAALLVVAMVAVACADDDTTDDGVDDTEEVDEAAEADDEAAEADDDAAEADDEATENGYEFDEQPDDAAAMLEQPADGDTVSSPVPVEMAAEGVDIVPAGAPEVGEAHLHVIVDTGCVETGELIPGPSDEATADGYIHFGDGSTSGEIDLEPGEYELCVQLADGVHRAFGETQVIQITVE
jgi:hypothetical protein